MPCDVARVPPTRIIPPPLGWPDFEAFRSWAIPAFNMLGFELSQRIGGAYTIPAKITGAPTANLHPWSEIDGDGTIISGDAGGRNSDNVVTAIERNGVVGTWTDAIVQMEITFSDLGTGPVARFTAPISAAGGTPPAPIQLQNDDTPIEVGGSTFINIPSIANGGGGISSFFQFVDNGTGGDITFITSGMSEGDTLIFDGTNWVAAPPVTVSVDGSPVTNFWNINFDSDYFEVTEDADGEITVAPNSSGAAGPGGFLISQATGATAPITHDTGIPILGRGAHVTPWNLGEVGSINAMATSIASVGFFQGTATDNTDITAVTGMPGTWAATWRVESGTLRIKFTTIPAAGATLKIWGAVITSPVATD